MQECPISGKCLKTLVSFLDCMTICPRLPCSQPSPASHSQARQLAQALGYAFMMQGCPA